MARRRTSANEAPEGGFTYCGLAPQPAPSFAPDVRGERLEAILAIGKRWLKNTPLTYFFYQGPDAQKAVVRRAFKMWNDAGCGLEFREVARRADAVLGIGFKPGDGSWSYVGRDALNHPNERTMNFGWDLTQDLDTALHEIGHAIGFEHEHQNPSAGIEWDEGAVIADLAGPPNRWSAAKTRFNIIRKLDTSEVRGSDWDKDSVMHYPFKAGLIKKPPQFRTQPLRPAGGLSALDRKIVREWYPGKELPETELFPFVGAVLKLDVGEQANFVLRPPDTRKSDLFTVGNDDTVMELYEKTAQGLNKIAEDDDSGDDRNSALTVELKKGREYQLRIRTNYTDRPGACTVLWT